MTVTVITGATAGVGQSIALGLARAGHDLILGARSPRRAQATVDTIRAAVTDVRVEHRPLDLASIVSIREFAADLPVDAIDRLILNAAVMTTDRRETVDGFEMMMGTNALGHFALTASLVDRLRAASSPRVVTQSSESHRRGHVDVDDLQHRRTFSPIQAYHDSKQVQHVLAVELARRHDGIRSVVCQPGWVKSELGREMFTNGRLSARMAFTIGNALIGQTPDQGARSAVRAAIEPDIPSADTGWYMTPSRLQRLRGEPELQEADRRVLDADLGAALWQAAAAQTGVLA